MIKNIQSMLGQTDIYLVDQIMKGRYQPKDIILDAGCGNGRNMHWFLQHKFQIHAIDASDVAIENLQNQFPYLTNIFLTALVEQTPFKNDFFDHIICSAVLHFAKNTNHFNAMFTEMVRILKPNGTLFIRMTSDIGIEQKIIKIHGARLKTAVPVYLINDPQFWLCRLPVFLLDLRIVQIRLGGNKVVLGR